jgi:hypothetical protein
MTSFSWRCPFCNQNATITEENYKVTRHEFDLHNKYGTQAVVVTSIVCPNEKCREYAINAVLHDCYLDQDTRRWSYKPAKAKWQLVPRSGAKVFPDYVPEPIRADYEEACLTCDLSPKASAAFARRCLQKMIRDFWGIQKTTLFDEISALREKVDALTWDAIDSIRKIGNVGAHMKADVDLVSEVDPNEALKLIYLIEILVGNWYVSRNEAQRHLKRIVSLGEKKETKLESDVEDDGEE